MSLGYRGALLPVSIVQDRSFGPHTITFVNPDASPLNLTGATLYAQVRRDGVLLASFDVAITNASGGIATLGMSAATSRLVPAGTDPSAPSSKSEWDLVILDAAGRLIPVYYGSVTAYRSVTRVP